MNSQKTMEKTVRISLKIILLLFLLIEGLCEQPLRYIFINLEYNKAQIPIVRLSQLCSPFNSADYSSEQDTLDKNIDLILDSGSSELWIANDQCQNCPKKSAYSMCPQTFNTSIEIKYMTGLVKGKYSLVNLCGNAIQNSKTKFLCVNQAHAIDHFQTNGILGMSMGFNPNGLIFLKKYLTQIQQFQMKRGKMHNSIEKIVSFYIGSHEKKLIIGQIPSKYVKNVQTGVSFDVKKESNFWSFQGKDISINGQSLIEQNASENKIQFVIDTGASRFVFPSNLFRRLLAKLKQQISNDCIVEPISRIVCPDHTDQGLTQITLKIIPFQNRSLQITLEKQFLYHISKEGSIQFPFIQSPQNNDSIQTIILGSLFLKKYVFSMNLTSFTDQTDANKDQRLSFQIYENNHQILRQIELRNSSLVFLFLLLVISTSVGVLFLILANIQKLLVPKQTKVVI